MEHAPFRRVLILVLVVGALGLGGLALYRHTGPALPEAPAVVVRMREVARLETLDVSVYKKIDFSPDPPASDSLWKDVVTWARYSVNMPRGRALVFAEVHFGYDLSRFDASSLRIRGERVDVTLPPLEVRVELKPGETEVIGSNLDSEQTAKLLELARSAFEREARADPSLQARARASAERSIQVLLLTLGFREVHFEGSTELPTQR